MLGDLRVLDLGDELWLDTERVALQELFNMIRRYKLGRDVELHKRTVERSLLSLVGPGARDLLAVGPAEHDNARTELGIAVATDVGVDLICDAERTDEVKAALGVPEVGEAVAEIVRVEHGRPRYGIELDDSVIPQEAGLNERAVSFTKGCYVGQETVARLHYRGKPNRHLRGLRLSRAGGDRRAAAAGRARGRPRRHLGGLPRPRPDRAGAGAARGRARRHGGRRRAATATRRRAAVRGYFGGIDAARAAPTSTQRASASSSSTPSGSTSTKPVIGLRPGRPNSCTCGSRHAASVSSGSMRTTSSVSRITPTAMLPPTIHPTPPNIFRSTTSGRAAISSLTRAAKRSSYAIAEL